MTTHITKEALADLDMDSLDDRRKKLCLKFALKCRTNPCISELFKNKEKEHEMILRSEEIVKVNITNTEKYEYSSVPFLQRLLTKHEQDNTEISPHEES